MIFLGFYLGKNQSIAIKDEGVLGMQVSTKKQRKTVVPMVRNVPKGRCKEIPKLESPCSWRKHGCRSQ